jgi:hypothetical protein
VVIHTPCLRLQACAEVGHSISTASSAESTTTASAVSTTTTTAVSTASAVAVGITAPIEKLVRTLQSENV